MRANGPAESCTGPWCAPPAQSPTPCAGWSTPDSRQVNPADARSLYVALTPRGVALTDTVAPQHLDNERRLLAGLTLDEQHMLAHLLRKLLLGLERH